jgi:hypothetical protein
LRWQMLFYCVLPDSRPDCPSPFANPRFPLAAAGLLADGASGGPAALRFSLLIEIFSGGGGDGDGEVALAAATTTFVLRDDTDAGQCGAERCEAAAADAAAAAAGGCVDMMFDRKDLLEVLPP